MTQTMQLPDTAFLLDAWDNYFGGLLRCPPTALERGRRVAPEPQAEPQAARALLPPAGPCVLHTSNCPYPILALIKKWDPAAGATSSEILVPQLAQVPDAMLVLPWEKKLDKGAPLAAPVCKWAPAVPALWWAALMLARSCSQHAASEQCLIAPRCRLLPRHELLLRVPPRAGALLSLLAGPHVAEAQHEQHRGCW